MANYPRLRATLCLYLLLVVTIFLSGVLHAEGFQYKYYPPDIVPLFEPAPIGLEGYFADSTLFKLSYSRFTREISLDSTQNHILVEESFYDTHYRLPIMVDVEYYIQERLKFENRARWRESLRKTQKLTEATGGSGIELNIPVKIKSKAFKRIFGGDRVGLRVTGNISFELAGRTESREGSAVSSIEQRNNFTPKFKQTQQFRVEGRVGDKVTVSVDQNSEATFDFENTLKLTYDGDEDEIVQKIEAGNVNLSLPSTNYVSTGSNHQGLFGLKTQMRVGNFDFTGIASLERGENQSLSLTGGAQEQTFRTKDYEYVRDRYFFVDSLYRDRFESDINEEQMILVLDSSLFIRQLDIWKTALVGGGGGTSYNETVEGLAGIDPSVLTDTTEDVSGKIESGRFRRLTEGVDYDFDYQRGYFWLKSQPSTNEVIAIAYRTNTNQVGELFQDIDTTATDSTPVKLKLVKPRAPNPSYQHTWSLSMRNVYNLGASGLSADGFEARVIYAITGEDQEVDPTDGKTYNNLMGLDRLNEQGDVIAGGDKKIDLGQRFIFDLGNGYLIFPSRTPFAPTNTFSFNQERHVEIYNTNDRTFEQQESKFEIEVKTTSVSTTFDLGFNVLEGSEKVTLNGRALTRDRDYTIDYFSGTLDITAPEARRADAQVDIEYERGALFQLDKKTLLGGRLEYQFGERNFIGLTALYYSKSTLDQRVRLGQEPLKNFIWDINTSLHFKPNFLSKIFDALPIVETSAESNLKIEAEYAEVRPNPNTFNEKALGDNDGVAYIDDFEGSKRFTSLGIQYRIWSPASVPVRFRLLSDPTVDYGPSGDIQDYVLGMDRKRAQFNWFNPFDQVPTQSIWPDRDVTAQSGTTTNVLVLRWRNDEVTADSAWAGVMRSTANFPDQKKTKFIELWVRGEKGQLNIDIGKISEDYYVKGSYPHPNTQQLTESYNNLNNEDINFNGLLDEGEDTGIDGVAGRDGDNVPNDAGDDDWAEPRATQPEFLRINGTEGNGQAQGARYPDTEDLDGDGALNRFNDYFEYSFDLADPENPYLVSQTFFDNGRPTGWKLYRVPIKDYDFKVGSPDTTFQQIFNVRLWVNNMKPRANDYDTVLVATFDFVGNEWEETGIDLFNNGNFVIDDEKFSITVYNTDEHLGPPANYTSPPDVEGIKDRITQAVSKEQSLVMQLKELPRESRAEARKQFREKINLINYKRMKMFVYGNRLLPNDSLVFYIRFGPTDRVYYEYREKVVAGWAGENEIEIDFEELAKTKDEQYQINANVPDSLNELPVYRRRDPNFPNKEFYVVGTPGLHNINYVIIGAINKGERDLIDREIWLDELRLTGVDRQSGTAMRLLTDLSIADIATFRAQWELVDDNFRRLEQQFASANGKDMTREKQSYFASLRLNKFMPESWGLDIPVDGKYTRSRDVPKYFYNSDRPTNYNLSGFTDRMKAFFGLNQEADSLLKDQIYFTESKSIGGTIRRRDRPRDPWLLRLTVNQLIMDADYSTKHSTSPTDEYADDNSLSGRLSYKIPFGKNNYIRPFGWLGKSWFLKPLSSQKLYYLPSSASANFTISDNESVRKNRLEAEEPAPNINVKTTEKFSLGYKLTESLVFDFNRDYLHDPRLKEQDSTGAEGNTIVTYKPLDVRAKDVLNNIFTNGEFGTVKRISQRFGANWTPKIANWLSPSYRYNSNFIYSLDRPQINARSSSLTINHNIRVDFKLATLLEKIYKPKPKKKTTAGGARGARGGRGSSQSQGKDKEEGKDGEKDKEKSGKKLPIPLNPALWVWHILYSFKSATIDIKSDDSYAHANLMEIPGLKYQFGFETDPYQKDEFGNSIVDTTFRKVVAAPNIRNTRGIDGSMQVDIIQNLKTSLKYNYQKVDNQSNEQRTQSISNTVFFMGEDPDNNQKDWWKFVPDWRLSLSGVEKLPLFNLLARTASLEHARSGKFTESSRFQGENQNRDQWGYSNNYQPFLGITINTIWGITASVRNNSSVAYDYRSAGATTRREQSGINFSASYSVTKGFRIPLPFLNKKELKNEIQFSLAFDKTSSKNFSKSITDTEFQELDVSETWKLRPSITYRFSQKVNGTAFYEQSKSSNKRTGTTTYKEFGINVNIAIR